MLEKGFLGPIGDDLPSLIPLLFALLVFFGTFSFSFGVFNNKNSSFESDIAVLNIARVLKGTNYITGYADFAKKCASINITEIKYRAVITNYFTSQEDYSQRQGYPLDPPPRSYSIGAFLETPNIATSNNDNAEFGCTNTLSTGVPDFSDVASSASIADLDGYFAGQNLIAKVYPLVVEDNKVVKPMHLVVVAWRS